ncbi:fructosamine kinase [Oscillochloris trichoides DG-6]|uniref:Fructosamine kinase n=1 Tax=Oscillochloris trichoides DG-6 TaxID=765420 RepID=E1IAR1_9CHLR|nr:fructosamine kinase family protein [Oscillochloris trichoides]EFO81740.1 fructosamine kinase [Oscillochloris trichoides DG-6]
MSLPATLRSQIEAILGDPIRKVELLAQSFGSRLDRLYTSQGRFALKWASRPLPLAMAAEAHGLRTLAQAGVLAIPEVLAVVDPAPADGYAFLLTNWLDGGNVRVDMAVLGEQLAQLHRISAPAYGFDHDNYIGGNPQYNTWMQEWPHFFVERRLRPQMELAAQQGYLPTTRRHKLDRLLARVEDLLAGVERQPALLHGDLWGGNVIPVDPQGRPGLIDPAVYFGDREAELAFTELFGGFGPVFYQAYQRTWPLPPGYAERRDLYNLYHLLNHLNLFGAGYAFQVDQIIQRYAG